MRTLFAEDGVNAYAAYSRFMDLFILPLMLVVIGWVVVRRRAGKPVMSPADEREAEFYNRFYKLGFWVFYLGCLFALDDDPTGVRQTVVLFFTFMFATAAIFVMSLQNAWRDYTLEREALD